MPLVMLGNIIRSTDSKLRERFVKVVLGNILEDRELLHTLKGYIDSDMNASVAAKELFIHKNTLFYRLRKIKKATGLDPQKPLSAFYLWLALCAELFVQLDSVEQEA